MPGRASSHVPLRLLWSWVVGGRHPREVASDRCTLLSLQELGLLQDYLLALTTDDHLLRCAAQVPPPPRLPPPSPRAPVQAPPRVYTELCSQSATSCWCHRQQPSPIYQCRSR